MTYLLDSIVVIAYRSYPYNIYLLSTTIVKVACFSRWEWRQLYMANIALI